MVSETYVIEFPFSYLILGVELQICPQGPTCCTRAMETRLGEWSSQQYRKALQRRTDQMAAPFKAKATQLDGKKIVINFVLQKMVFRQQFVLKSAKC